MPFVSQALQMLFCYEEGCSREKLEGIGELVPVRILLLNTQVALTCLNFSFFVVRWR